MSIEVDSTPYPIRDLSVPKSSMTVEQEEAVVANGSDVESNGEAAAEPPTAPKKEKKTPVKRKPAAKKAKKEDDDEPAEPTTPKPAKKRVTKPKKEKEVKSEVKAVDDEDTGSGEEVAAAPATPAADAPAVASSSKKRVAAKAYKGETETPTKKRKTKAETNGDVETPAKATKAAASKTPKAKASKFPESFDEFSEGDKLLVRMRKEGKDWKEVEKAWIEITEQQPGKDVLRKREAKLRPLAQEWKAGDARKLAEFKAQVEKEKWGKIADMFKSAGTEYSGASVQKKWEMLVKKNEVDAAGNYTGNDAAVPEASASDECSDAGAPIEEEMKDDGGADADNEDGSEEPEAGAENEDA